MLKQLLLTLFIALAPTIGCAAAEPTPAEAERIKQVAALTDEQVLERSIQWLPVGGASPDKERRMIGWRIESHGWGPALKRHGQYIERAKCRGLWVHNPWGHDGVWPMEWDQRLILRELAEQDPTLKVVDDTFLPEFRKFLAGDYTGGRRPDVWFYLGTSHVWEGMEKYRSEPQAWWQRARESCEPILTLAREFRGQVAIVSDRTFDLPADHPHYAFLTSLAAAGIEVVIEPRPGRDYPHLFQFGCVVKYGIGLNGRQDPTLHVSAARKFAADHQVRGGKYALLTKELATIENARKSLERGYVPVLGTQYILGEE